MCITTLDTVNMINKIRIILLQNFYGYPMYQKYIYSIIQGRSVLPIIVLF